MTDPSQSQDATVERDETLAVGVRFQNGGKIYSFSMGETTDLVVGDYVLVNTAWGRQIGEVVYIHEVQTQALHGSLKPILCRASGADLALRQRLKDKAQQSLETARELAARRSLQIKLAAAEYTLDGKRLTILYASDNKEGLRELQKELSRQLRARVELRQIGPRDHAKLLNGHGACGEHCCCARFLSEFSPVSIRAAKTQEISLAPSEITGMCGRLRCCLVYEHDMYIQASKELPKRKANVRTPYGTGKVVGLLPLKESVIVQIEDRRLEIPADQIQVLPKETSQTKN